jgi:hypothetical protein
MALYIRVYWAAPKPMMAMAASTLANDMGSIPAQLREKSWTGTLRLAPLYVVIGQMAIDMSCCP